jgi:hypothetical protein
MYDIETMEIKSQYFYEFDPLTSNKINFPWKAFFNLEKSECYVFYRQGHSFIVPVVKGHHSCHTNSKKKKKVLNKLTTNYLERDECASEKVLY